MVVIVGTDLYRKEIIVGDEKYEISATTFGNAFANDPVVSVRVYHRCGNDWREDEEFVLPKVGAGEIVDALEKAVKVAKKNG